MGKKKRRTQRQARTAGEAGQDAFAGGLGDLLRAQGLSNSKAAASQASPPASANPAPSPALEAAVDQAQRWIVRISKKGRGGKEATLVSPRGLPPTADLAPLARRIRRELGCGATVEGEGLAVQGDQRVRLEAWLIKNGARGVTQG